ncbi:MAG: RNA polymerase sigma factor [Nocardioides sp.]
MSALSEAEVDRIFREEYGRVVASLIRRFGSIDIAEDAASEALLAAVERWPEDGVPPNPGGWLTTTAARKAIDKIRRESHRDAKHQQAAMIAPQSSWETPHQRTGAVDDDRLRLIFICCHPALAPEARVALTLRLLGGLTVPEIAAAFLVSETTMGQRITRAKKKIAAANIPYRVPAAEDLPSRVSGVLAVLYLVFNEGYLSTSGSAPMRVDLTAEAIRLCRVLRSLLPTEPEVAGLLALMLLTDARRTQRFSTDGVLVPLRDQDRGAWDGEEIAEGLSLVRECLAVNRPGVYQIQAAVNAVHTSARTAAETDWSQIAALYGQLLTLNPSPVVALNRAVALSELDGPAVGLAEVDRLDLASYHPWHVTRAELLRRLDRPADARTAYDAALALIDNPAEAAYLTGRRDSL